MKYGIYISFSTYSLTPSIRTTRTMASGSMISPVLLRADQVLPSMAICNGPIWLQIALFFVVSIVTLAATRPLVTKLMKKDIKPTNADRVLGGLARVTERIDNDVPTGAVYIDGKTWSARSSSGESIEPDTMVRVVRMEGVKLYVEAEKEA